MDEKRWWLVEGVMVEVEDSSGLIDIWRLNKPIIKNIKEGVLKDKITPVGVPFDCTPEWCTQITFNKLGMCYFEEILGENEDGSGVLVLASELPCHFEDKCPEEWRGKTFEITDELRGLLND